MKVLMQNRLSSQSSIAGDTIQMEKTGEYLRKLGVDVVFDVSHEPDLTGFDLVHLFNTIPIEDTYRQFRNAKYQNKRIVLSTVFWDPAEYLQNREERVSFENWWQATQSQRQEVVRGVDLILPNSKLELALLKKIFPDIPPALVIPNGVDRLFANGNSERFRRRLPWKEFVLSVGRISPRKNQLTLIDAAKRLKLPVVFIGPLNDGQYYQECRKKAVGAECLFVDTMEQSELASAYAAARVHALVSWYDTPGLVSLEAALAGCTIVTTDRGCAREYFEDLAFYCQPHHVDSICDALRNAWCSGRERRLVQKMLDSYTWENVAKQTEAAYRQCCD